MATELPHRGTLIASLFIGTKADLTTGMSELSELFPNNIEPDEKGWRVVNITPKFVEEVRDILIKGKLKLTSFFALTLMMHLGWVLSRRFTALYLSSDEPELDFTTQSWEWNPIKGASHDSDHGDDH